MQHGLLDLIRRSDPREGVAGFRVIHFVYDLLPPVLLEMIFTMHAWYIKLKVIGCNATSCGAAVCKRSIMGNFGISEGKRYSFPKETSIGFH